MFSSEPQRSERQLPAERKTGSTPTVGAVYSPPPQQQTQAIPDITPMRRGRPTTTNQAASSRPPKVTAGDPFAALDAKSGAKLGGDELSSRFPTLDQFSLLHDQGSNFDFDSPTSPQASSNGPAAQLNQRVTEHLADDAFARPSAKSTPTLENRRQPNDAGHTQFAAATAESHRPSPPLAPPQKPASSPPKPMVEKSKASTIISNNPELQAISSTLPHPKQEVPNRPIMVSTGTMTAPPIDIPIRDYSPIHRFPPADQHRSTSLPREQNGSTSSQIRLDPSQVPRPSPSPRIPSAQSQSTLIAHPSSSRPSLEARRPSPEVLEPLAKPSSSTSRSRPSSMYLESSMDYLREREASREASLKPSRTPGYPSPKIAPSAGSPRIEPQEEIAIQSNVEFLRSMEDNDGKKKHHSKRSSLGSLSGTKNILAGKFGDAFKRFEGNPTASSVRTPSPLKDRENHTLTPIAGSEATDGRSDDGHVLGEAELTPEMRRELEAQSLADEERRVEAAAAEYKQKMAARAGDIGHTPLPRSIGGVSRASSIQNRVQNLLEESSKSSQHVQRTASGYGKFSDEALARSREEKELPELPQRPTGTGHGPPPKPPTSSSEALARVRSNGQNSSSASRPVPPVKPNPAPKPTHLINLPTGGRRSPTKQQFSATSAYRASSDQLVGVGLPGRPALDMSFQEKEDYIQDFSKRFPSLSSIEMVERDIDAEADRKSGR
ncbi:hypothetical protein RRF57_005322 [Xylaria bambusicola]|uniref:Uncharacterized protein n=1 Tax=Xylaria bambusicola TaxID=326684 RepID=A0AAN7UJN1_9PEZI